MMKRVLLAAAGLVALGIAPAHGADLPARTYTKAPARAVSNDINTTEDMLALGLESRMAGTFGVTGDGLRGAPPALHPAIMAR